MNYGLFERFCTSTTLSYTLLTVSILGLSIPLLIGYYNLFLLGIYLAIPMVLGPVVYRKTRSIKPMSIQIVRVKNGFRWITLLYILVYTISIHVLKFYTIRPLHYFLLIAILGMLFVFQIFAIKCFTNTKVMILQLELIALFLNLIWGVNLKYYYFFGKTDVFPHSWFIQNLNRYGEITNHFAVYKSFPLWHILIDSVSVIMEPSLATHKMMFLVNGIIYCFLLIFIYKIALKVTGRVRIALMSSLFVSFNPIVINYAMYSIPRSVVSFLLIMLIYLLLCHPDMRKHMCAVILLCSIVAYHTASMPFIMFVFICLYIFELLIFRSEPKTVGLIFLVMCFVVTISYWSFCAIDLFEAIVFNVADSAPKGVLTKSIITSPLNELLNYIQYIPLLFFVIYGCLHVLDSNRASNRRKAFIVIGLLFVGVTLPGPGLLLNKLAVLNMDRFGEYTFPFICIAGAAGFITLIDKGRAIYNILCGVLVFVMLFLSISNDFTASDNSLVNRPFYTFYLSEGEVDGLKHVGTVSRDRLLIDYIGVRYLGFSEFENRVHIMEVDKESLVFLKEDRDVMIIRQKEWSKRPLKLFLAKRGQFETNPNWNRGASLNYYNPEPQLYQSIKDYNKFYDNNEIIALR